MRWVPARAAVSAITIDGAKSTGGLATSMTLARDLGGMFVGVVGVVVWGGYVCVGWRLKVLAVGGRVILGVLQSRRIPYFDSR